MELKRVLNYISPAIGVYSIFIYDFGEREHVFQPVSRSLDRRFCSRYSPFLLKVRRWGASIINTFFTLSAAEERLLHDSQASVDTDLSKN